MASTNLAGMSWNQIHQPQSSLQMTTAQANTVTAASRETLSQKLPAKLFPNS